ncbi:MAG: hypothetical protein K6A82_01860 [Prevotella sp.]|nr:hypothetical protein [Prevotella sp.]
MNQVVIIAKKLAVKLLPALKEMFRDFLLGKVDEFKNALNNKYIQKEFLNQQTLVDIARENIVPGSNEVCAWLKKNDTTYTVFLAYSQNRELLPKDKNKFIAIEAGGISRDVEKLFGDNELIILQ